MTSPKKLFALLVGIDNYPKPIQQLRGCVNDILAINKILEEKYGYFQLNIKILLNEEATRTNIIEAFNNHLGQASNQDTVLFYYAGHGSTEYTHKAFWEIEPVRKNETLVCFDSRQPDGLDLADKELAVLLHEVGNKTPYIVVCLDCCHSGSGTRDTIHLTAVRQIARGEKVRSLESYSNGYYAQQLSVLGKVQVPQTTHVLLSACQHDEKAYETDKGHGLFTSTLVECLKKASVGGITYAELFAKISIEVRNKQQVQHPNFEYFNQFNPHTLFLTNIVSDRIRTFPIYFDENSGAWKAGKGALYGLPTECINPIEIWIFDESETNLDTATKIAEAILVDIQPEESRVVGLPATFNRKNHYKGFQVGGGLKNVIIYSFLYEDGLSALGEYTVVDQPGQADYWLSREDEFYQVIHRLNYKVVAQSEDLEQINIALQKIARWENLRKLQNQASKINTQAIEVNFSVEGYKFKENQIEIPLIVDKNRTTETRKYSIEVSNNTDKDLYFNTLFISPLYGIYDLGKGVTIVPRGQKASIINEKTLGFFSEQKDDTESNCIFKIIASTRDIDLSSFTQKNFSLNIDFQSADKLVNAYRGSRFLEEEKSDSSDSIDWVVVKDIHLRMIKTAYAISASEPLVVADRKLSFQAHPKLKADVTFSQFFDYSRGTRSSTSLVKSIADNTWFSILNLGSYPDSIAAQVIELQNIEGDVSSEDPLILTIADSHITASEIVLPVTVAENEVIVIGSSQASEKGASKIYIDRLPDIASTNTRNIGRAIKFSLMKMSIKANPADYFQLRWVDFTKEKPERTAENIKQKVAGAHHILLLIHGLLGDTETMIPVSNGIIKSTSQPEAKYDLALTFDYECLNTPMEQIAANLNSELANVGITDVSGKKITIVAYSIGGLIARSLIEKYKKSSLVEKLIMAGTPNKGTIFGMIPTYISWATDILTFGLGYAVLEPYLAWAGGLIVALRKSEKLTITLAQMRPTSDYLRELRTYNDPHTPYYILAGRIDKYTVDGENWFEKIGKHLLVGMGNLFHEGEEHDTFIYTKDIKLVDETRSPKPVNEEIGCLHILYFKDPSSVEIIQKWLGE